MVITVFRSRLRPDAVAEYAPHAERIEALARTMPGFRAIKTFAADDGERVSIVEFESLEAVDAWRRHPEHREAQRLGRERYYLEYELTTCEPVRSYRFAADDVARD
jgi:heme-degrading monooxygenase HmoA